MTLKAAEVVLPGDVRSFHRKRVPAMLTTATPARVEGTHVVDRQAPTLGWALRRTLIGIVILAAFILGAASLLYASIEPDQEDTPAATSPDGVSPSVSSHGPAALSATRV
jgi:hypothetical protein